MNTSDYIKKPKGYWDNYENCKNECRKYGKSAGYRRNVVMSENADSLIAFWNGESKWTKHMIDIMQRQNKPYRIIKYK